MVVIGPQAPDYAGHPSVLLAAAGLEDAAASLSLLGAGQMDYLDSPDGAWALDRTLQAHGVPITVEPLPLDDLALVLKQILGHLAGLEASASFSELESFYGVPLHQLADHLKRLAGIGV